ncbi:hypothetical protein PsorP6_001218 [Peronosclerospora sorghi]|uniref:Uncharacterized protein n=1 Tax=Peronosclerospora sorghi TaxID=230839 RepID=A0ACC0WTQ6_9STRA|nr:hypothetical protein PsorP6_001218 [Peronosclerospora sorghi]
MWRKRRGSLNSNINAARDSPNVMTSTSLIGTPSSLSMTSGSPFFGSDPNANDRAIVFRLDVPTPGPLGLDLRARHIERDKPQRGATVKGFRPLQGGKPGYVESTGRVKMGDILQVLHKTAVDDMPFEQIVKHAMQLQQDPTAWPLSIEFRREPERQESTSQGLSSSSFKSRRNSIFRSSISMNPVPDGNFNEKLQYFRGFFSTRIPTGGAAPKLKEKPPKPQRWETVDEMYRELMSKRGVPEDVMDELIRIESLETKWHVVWYAQQNENEDNTKSNSTEAKKFAENLVELKWDNKGLKDLEALRGKISVASTDWLEAFLAYFGLDYLTMKLPDPSPFPIEHSKYEKATRVCEVILRILRSLTHFTAGVEAITNTPGLVKRVALCFHTDDGDVKKYTLQLLGIICYNSAAGHAAVIEAFDHYKEAKGETIRFSCLRDALKSTRYSLVFKEDVLSFVNIIVNKAIRLEDRLAIRSDFMALKMAGYFEEIRAKSLAVQRTKFPLASSAAAASVEEGYNRAPSPVPGAGPATPSPIPYKHIARNTPSPVLSSRSSESPGTVRGMGPGTPVTDSFRAFNGRRSSTSRARNDQRGSHLSASKSAPPSPVDREPASLSPDGAILRSSLPLDTKYRYANGGNSIISSSVTQLRNQLDNMEKQIDVFEQFMEDDRKDTIYEHTDLSSLDSVYQSLSAGVNNDPQLQACFLSILQQLLFIPGDRVIGKEMWAIAEKVMKQITLLAPIEEVRNFDLGYDDRKTLLKMRDRYAQFLQKCADEDPTFRYHMGPIILIENMDRDHDELALSDTTAEETDEEDMPVRVAAHLHPDLIKYFKLLKMGMSIQHVQLKMSSELPTFDQSILEFPDRLIPLSKAEGEAEPRGTRAEEHEKYAKFFKLKKMGMPLPHIQLKMSAEGLESSILETPDLLVDENGKEIKERAAGTSFSGIPVREHEKFAKFFKLLKMGMPLEHVQLKAASEGLDSSLLSTADQLLDEEGKLFVANKGDQPVHGIPVKDHEKFAKFFKLMKMGMPLEHIKLKASAEGLDGELLSTPDTLLNKDGSKFDPAKTGKGVQVKEHEKFAKFFKLMKLGMPLENIKLKASAEGLDGKLLSTPDAIVDEDGKRMEETKKESKGTPVKDHEKFVKFFKLLKMGMPIEHVKLKVSSEGLDANLLETPEKLVDENGNEVKETTMAEAVKPVPVKQHEKFAKFFKLMKMGMPLSHVKLKAVSEGLDGDLLDTPDKLVDQDGKEIKDQDGKEIKSESKKMVKVSEHPRYAKYFKLLKMGMPRPQLELKMSAESLDPTALDRPDEMIPEDLSSAVFKVPKENVAAKPSKPKLRNLYWEAVKSEETTGTIWESFAREEDRQKKDDDKAPVGPPSVAGLFAVQANKPKPKSAASKSDVLDQFVDQLSNIFVSKAPVAKESEVKTPTKRRAPTRVALIDAKRANNIGIMLARFRLPYAKLRNAVLLVDKELLSVERVSSLLQFAPEDDELDAVRAYTGDPKLLGDAEQYFREMDCIPRLTTRLQAIHATWQFDAYVEEQRKLMESVSNACRELQACEPLKDILRVVLSLGNALNDGTSRGGAKGFRLNILLKLNQVKAADNSINLLNYVAQVLRAKDPAILEFDKSLPSLESASRVTMQVLKAGESAVRKAANIICNELEVHAKLPEKEYTQDEPVDGSEEVPAKISDRFQEVYCNSFFGYSIMNGDGTPPPTPPSPTSPVRPPPRYLTHEAPTSQSAEPSLSISASAPQRSTDGQPLSPLSPMSASVSASAISASAISATERSGRFGFAEMSASVDATPTPRYLGRYGGTIDDAPAGEESDDVEAELRRMAQRQLPRGDLGRREWILDSFQPSNQQVARQDAPPSSPNSSRISTPTNPSDMLPVSNTTLPQPPASPPSSPRSSASASASASMSAYSQFQRQQQEEEEAFSGAVVWGTNISVSESMEVFRTFVRQFRSETSSAQEEPYYVKALRKLALTQSLVLDLDTQHLRQFVGTRKLYNQLILFPQVLIRILDMVVTEEYHALLARPGAGATMIDDVANMALQVRPFNLRDLSPLRHLNPSDIDQLVCLKGMVTRCSGVLPDLKEAFFRCAICHATAQVTLDRGRIEEPTSCARCSSRMSMEMIHNRCAFTDKQMIKMQETPDAIPEGETPYTVLLFAFDDLVDGVRPGDKVEVTGIYRAVPMRSNSRQRVVKSVFKTYVDVVHFRRVDELTRREEGENGENLSSVGREIERVEASVIGPADFDVEMPSEENAEADTQQARKLAAFHRIAAHPRVYENLAHSLAPSIWELDDVKKGILCMLFGGTRKDGSSGSVNEDVSEQEHGRVASKRKSMRSDMNVLLCGDPGTSKSQLLSYVHKLSPRSIYTSGKGSSAVGLTASLIRDIETNDLVLESGALVLSDEGICCIDEFDKMSDSARSVLHEVMEQQTVSIAKAGIICSLNARASILASANPIESRYNPNKSVVENVNIVPTLLSRFDLIYLILDKPQPEADRKLAKHIVALYYDEETRKRMRAQARGGETAPQLISMKLLTEYIAYAKRNIHPRLSAEARDALIRAYMDLRRMGGASSASAKKNITATPRQLESLIRISEALAKLKLCETVTRKDVDEALRLMNVATQRAAMDPRTGTIDMDMINTGHSVLEREVLADLVTMMKEILSEAPNQSMTVGETRRHLEEKRNSEVKGAEFQMALRSLEDDNLIQVSHGVIRFFGDPTD